MKATNVYQSLKSKGVCGTDGMKPKLPGIGSPLKKSPYKFNAGLKEAAAEGKLDENPKFKDAVESSPAKKTIDPPKGKKKSKSKDIDPGFYTNFPTVSGKDLTLQKRNIETKKANAERRRNETPKNATENAKKSMKNFSSSPAKKKVDGKKAKLISEKTDPKTGITTKKYDVGTNMPKIVKTKSSPAKKKGCKYKK